MAMGLYKEQQKGTWELFPVQVCRKAGSLSDGAIIMFHFKSHEQSGLPFMRDLNLVNFLAIKHLTAACIGFSDVIGSKRISDAFQPFQEISASLVSKAIRPGHLWIG